MNPQETPVAQGTLPNAIDPRANGLLFGHKKTRALLETMFVENHFPHALLLTGHLGIGKSTLAWNIARQLVETGTISEGFKPSQELLERYKQFNHPSIYSLTRPSDDKGGFKEQIAIEAVRDLNNKLYLAATDGGWRAVIIDPIDAVNTAASNALLKLLEEPPHQVVFFLISHRPGNLIPTIKSRCQIHKLKALSIEEMRNIWEAVCQEPLPEEDIFILAEGSVRDAMNSADQLVEQFQTALHILDDAPRLNLKKIHNFSSQILETNRSDSYAQATRFFGLLFGRILRNATGNTSDIDPSLINKIAPTEKLGAWAELGFKTYQELQTGAKLNLDAQATIFQRWMDIEELVRK